MKIICLVLLVSILEVGITTSILIAVAYTHLLSCSRGSRDADVDYQRRADARKGYHRL